MRAPFVKTAVAVLLCAGLGYFAWREFQKEDTGEKKDKVFTFDKTKVKAVTLKPAGGDELRVVKQGDFWRLAAPADQPASTAEVESLIASVEALEVQEIVTEAPSSLEPYGLDPPQRRASVTLDGAAEALEVLLGATTPDGSAVYAKLPAQPRLFTIASWQAGALDKQPFDLRDRDLLHVQRDNVRTLEVSGPEGGFTLARDEQGEWAITRPLATRAGRWSVDSLVGLVENLRMDAVAAEQADDLKPYGLDKPARTVTLGLADGGTKRLEIGSASVDKKYHAREASSRLVAIIPGALVDDLAKGLDELRAKRLLDVSTYDVEGLDVRLDGQEWAFERSSTKEQDGLETFTWKRTKPEAKDADTSKVEDLLFKLTGLEVQEFVDKPGAPPAYGLDKPALEATLRVAGKPPQKVTIGRQNDAAYARRDGDEAVLKLDSTKVDEALKDLKAL